MPGLTFSVALFFLLVMIPGYVGLWASGRIDEARQKFYPALYRGIMNFGIVLFWSFLLSERFPFAGRFEICQTVGNYLASGLSALFATFSGRHTGLSWENLFFWFLIFYTPALFLGAVELGIDMRSNKYLKNRLAWRRFLVGGSVLEASARDDVLWDIFLCYRAVGKRPVVLLNLDGTNEPLRGEVLKVSWGNNAGMLIGEMDDPRHMPWAPLSGVRSVKFLNPGIRTVRGTIDNETRKFLNMVHPGYADEVEEKFRRQAE